METEKPLVLGILRDKAALGVGVSLTYTEARQLVIYIKRLQQDLDRAVVLLVETDPMEDWRALISKGP